LTPFEKLSGWGNTVDPEKENKQYLDQLEEKKGVQMMNQ
jgi:hypothetical protein